MKLKKTDKDFILNSILGLIKKDQINSITLFGSYARGTASEKSDVDIAINMGTPIPAHIWVMIEEKLDESDLLMKVDIVDYHRVSESFQKLIDESGEIICP